MLVIDFIAPSSRERSCSGVNCLGAGAARCGLAAAEAAAARRSAAAALLAWTCARGGETRGRAHAAAATPRRSAGPYQWLGGTRAALPGRAQRAHLRVEVLEGLAHGLGGRGDGRSRLAHVLRRLALVARTTAVRGRELRRGARAAERHLLARRRAEHGPGSGRRGGRLARRRPRLGRGRRSDGLQRGWAGGGEVTHGGG
jgi:hypothetical protein